SNSHGSRRTQVFTRPPRTPSIDTPVFGCYHPAANRQPGPYDRRTRSGDRLFMRSIGLLAVAGTDLIGAVGSGREKRKLTHTLSARAQAESQSKGATLQWDQ